MVARLRQTPALRFLGVHRLCPTSVPLPISTLTPCQKLGWEQARCISGPCSAIRVGFLLLSPEEYEAPVSEALAKCLSDTCLPPSFKKRRGHSIGGAPEQRYQSIPVCVAVQPPTQAQDVLVRVELGHMHGVLIWGV